MPEQEPGRTKGPIDLKAELENKKTRLMVEPSETASGHAEERTTEEVRQGHTGDHVRYILALSAIGAAALLAIALFFFVN